MQLVPADLLHRQITLVLASWGMDQDQVEITAKVMVDTDLRGVDSHGISMVPVYADWLKRGWLTLPAPITVASETPATAVVDAGHGLGHAPSVKAMELAIAKAKALGLAAAVVRNSTHYGAAGYYPRLAAAAGLMGWCVTNGQSKWVMPTFGAEPRFGTNPIAFAAPAKAEPPFVLDMATTTVAVGKIRNAAIERRAIPEGWATDAAGKPTTDGHIAYNGGSATPLGGTPERSSHKGYGLAVMVEILSALLSGGTACPLSPKVAPDGHGLDNGHFMLVVDPKAFRPDGGFPGELDRLMISLRGTRPIDPKQPVLVAGDKEEKSATARAKTGIPVPPGLMAEVKKTCEAAGAKFLLG
ncbi:MAG: Ldh family oxidoreductase [Proteobacteria bacterium]|nr:Ldh family oxidoreductase [Pseudomonadota bacterium]MBI3495892.1 Ldh family oxidoreductase [Pseudomonadota bacterium]